MQLLDFITQVLKKSGDGVLSLDRFAWEMVSSDLAC